MNNSTRQRIIDALDAVEPTPREADDDFEAIVSRTREPKRGRIGLTIAAAAVVSLMWSRRSPLPPAPDETLPWTIVQVNVDEQRTDLRVRVRRPLPPQSN